ncbi:S-adenosyl-L-methionine-dependent methyltransferase [Phlyctochytrium arcticum]|nr:S-adenosyl-L-methionine-dependent methyltransferase [Phlyctochytrium arcticum]
MRVATDFSGIEAPIVALQQLGVEYSHEWSCEIDAKCRKMIQSNHSPKRLFEDITTRDHSQLPEIDVYVAGFPCQSFSGLKALNQRIPENHDSIRSNLSIHCIQTIQLKKPKIFILENVPRFKTFMNGEKFNNLLAELNRDDEYSIHHAILNTKDYGIPQNRHRLYIVGIRKDCQTKPFEFPQPFLPRPLSTFLDTTINEFLPLDKYPRRLLERLPVDRKNKLYAVKHRGGEGIFEQCAPCITTSCSIFVTQLNRDLTPREKFTLQGFSVIDTNIVVSDSVLAKQAGNTMSVNVLKALFVSVFDCIQ